MTLDAIQTEELPELLAQLGEYEAALVSGLAALEDDASTEETVARVVSRLDEFSALTERLGKADHPEESAEWTAVRSRMQAIRLRHQVLVKVAGEKLNQVGTELGALREFRKKANFYGASGSELGSSCDIAG